MIQPADSPLAPPWRPPAIFEEYRILSPLSRGGMGEVYLGHDTLLDRPVAIKFIRAIEPDAFMREQFLIEARAAARIQHPNVVSVYRVGEIQGQPYIISEFIRGQSLDTLPKPVGWQRALELGLGLVRGLAAAHRCGILHRDLKPANAIVSSTGDIKLLDFGLAEFVDREPVSVKPHLELGVSARSKISGNAETIELLGGATPGQRRPSQVGTPPSDDKNRRPSGPSARGSQDGAVTRIVGTPSYLAPELWRGEPSSLQSDIYAMGALLFELCTGKPPHHSPLASYAELARAATTLDAPPLATLVPEVDPHFAAVVQRCLRRPPGERYASGEELRLALEQLRPSELRVVAPEGNPYRGLFAFEAEHRSVFFGRSNEIGTLLERLRTESFLLVAADSGIGKSSLCRAGFLPLIREGALGGGRSWRVLSLVPGRSPLAALAAALAPILDVTEAQLATQLRTEPSSLGRELHGRLGLRSGVVLFIDQLEEIVTIAEPTEAAAVGQALGRLTSGVPGVRMLMTARSDYLARIATVPTLGDELGRALYFLRPMYPEKIRQAIVGPARSKGVRFESPKLVDALVEETAKTDGGLPLLQFALTELWDARTDDLITVKSLAAIGGVSGALARHADHVILSLAADRRLAARRILMLLVSLEGTRARRTEEELGQDDASRQALEALVRGRMIVAHATSEGVTYEVAHEALLKGWSTLRHWLEEFADRRAVKQRLELAAAEWSRLGRAREALWSPRQLAELHILEATDFTAREREFISASRHAHKRGRLLRRAAIVTVPLVLAVFYGGIQYRHIRERRIKVARHLRRGQDLLALAQKKSGEVDELRKLAFAAFDSQHKEEGEQKWSRALKLAQESEAALGQASQALEAALTYDPGRDDVRELLAQTLFEGALSAERDQQLSRRNDLLQRMGLYDVDGERQRRWQAPARVTIATTPPGAQVTLQQYEEDEQKRRTLLAGKVLGHTPLQPISRPPGSYLLTFELPGRAPVRYPVLLHRAEDLRVDLTLPPSEAVPSGYVYVPPGRFLFGTSSDESVRQGFLSTVPVHEVASPAYLIGRFEVTYADWLEYLRALPPAERAARTIHVPKGGIGGGVDLTELADGSWQLTLQPVTQAHVAGLGGMIVYRARKVRAEQDWQRLPVSGIGPPDILAYAEWLDRTGRVPGARLCSEKEWERAARGADDREYPHGSLLDPEDANFDETYGRDVRIAGPDAVGSYPVSASPFGLLDMAGNVFEWAASSLAPGELVARSGGYFMGAIASRSTNRTPLDPSFRDPGVGIRLCASFPANK